MSKWARSSASRTSKPSPDRDNRHGLGTALLTGLGLALLAGSYLPLHRLLALDETGPAGVQTRAAAEAAWASGLMGTGMVLVVAVLLARIFAGSLVEERAAAVGKRLARIPIIPFSLGVGGLALFQGILIAWSVHGCLQTG